MEQKHAGDEQRRPQYAYSPLRAAAYARRKHGNHSAMITALDREETRLAVPERLVLTSEKPRLITDYERLI